jgi:hypothetical protein
LLTYDTESIPSSPLFVVAAKYGNTHGERGHDRDGAQFPLWAMHPARAVVGTFVRVGNDGRFAFLRVGFEYAHEANVDAVVAAFTGIAENEWFEHGGLLFQPFL